MNFWGYCNNGRYSVGCNGATVYILNNEGNELARFRDVKAAYSARFLPNTNTVAVKNHGRFSGDLFIRQYGIG